MEGGEIALNWDAIGAMGEIMGSLIVAITLLLLIAQLRQNTKSIRMASRSQVTETINAHLALSIQNDELSQLVHRGLKGYDSLEPNAKGRFSAYAQHNMRIWELSFFQWKEGEFDEVSWRAVRAHMLDLLATSDFLIVFRLRRSWYDERFVDYVENELLTYEPQTRLEYL
jgi:hypothetical protein